MPLLEVLETRGLFRLTRFVAFVIIFLLTVALIVGGTMFFKDLIPNDESHVSYKQIYSELTHTPSSNSDDESTQPSSVAAPDNIDIPLALQPYVTSTTNMAVLKEHLDSLDSEDRAEYLSNLAEVVTSAKNSGTSSDQMIAVINRYFVDKTEQLNLANLDKTARRERQLFVLGGGIGLIGMIAIASLILVLLAIERNTRSSRSGLTDLLYQLIVSVAQRSELIGPVFLYQA